MSRVSSGKAEVWLLGEKTYVDLVAQRVWSGTVKTRVKGKGKRDLKAM